MDIYPGIYVFPSITCSATLTYTFPLAFRCIAPHDRRSYRYSYSALLLRPESRSQHYFELVARDTVGRIVFAAFLVVGWHTHACMQRG